MSLRTLNIAGVIGLILVFSFPLTWADENTFPPEVLKPFEEAKQTGDIQILLSIFHKVGQANNKEAAAVMLNVGLSSEILEGLTEEQTQQVRPRRRF